MRTLSVAAILCAGLISASLLAIVARAGEPAIVVGDPVKLLLLDRRVVAETTGVRLTLGRVEKEPRNPLFKADRPWENALNNLYPNVTYDAQDRRFKLWYKCVLVDEPLIARLTPPRTIHNVAWMLAYATSTDGLAWEKPELGLYTFDGSKRNNIACRDVANVGVLHDPHDRDPARRFKMIYDVGFNQMRVRFSADGLHWGPEIIPRGLEIPEGQGRSGDTHNNAFWDAQQGKYVLITRNYLGQRTVARSESRDFLDWQPPQIVLRSTPAEDKAYQTYCMPAFPYAQGYLGYVMLYRATTDRTVDCELTWSPDSVHWERVCPGQPLIPRGPAGSYDSQCIYAPAGPAIAQDHRLLIFYGGSDVAHRGWKRHCLPCLARLRMDGFAGYEPEQPRGRGTIVTQPLRCTGQPLRITADAHAGSLRAAVLDVPGHGLDDCQPIVADVTDEPVRWKGGQDFTSLKGRTVRLKFQLDGAKLYAIGGVELATPPRE